MLKKQKIKILSIAAGSIAGTGIAIAAPVAIALNQNEIKSSNNSLSIQDAKATTTSASTGTDEKGFWLATGLGIFYGVVALIIACVAFAFLYKNNQAKKKQREINKSLEKNLINDHISVSPKNLTKKEVEDINKIDTLLKDEKVNEVQTNEVIESCLNKSVIVDTDNPVDFKKYYESKEEGYLPNIVYLKATPEHNFLFNDKNILCVEKPFDNDKKDILVYDLWSHKITGYAKVADVLQTNKNDLYDSIKEFSAFARKDFNELYKDSEEACLLFCDNIVRFKHPIDPETVGIESLYKEESVEEVENVLVYQQIPVVVEETKIEIEEQPMVVEEVVADETPAIIEEELVIEEAPIVNEQASVFVKEVVKEIEPVIEQEIIIEEEPVIVEEIIPVVEEEVVVDEPVIVEETISKIEFDNNELAKQSSKIEPVISNDVEIVKPVAKNEIEDIIKANEQTPSEIIREDNEFENKVIYPKFKIKTIIDKQTRKNAPITFLVTKQEKNNISNTYEINNKNNKRNKEQKITKEYTYNKKKISNSETEMLKKEGKFYKFKPSTHPKVREEQIKIMNDFCEKNNNKE